MAMNRLIEFLHDSETKTVHLGNEGFFARRCDSGEVCVWYRGCMLCRLTLDGLQWVVQTYPLSSRADCNRMTELLALLGMPQLRVRYSKCGEYIQRTHNNLVMAEYSLPLKQPLRVSV